MEFFRETIYPRDHFWVDRKNFYRHPYQVLKDGNETVFEITAIYDYKYTHQVLLDKTNIKRGFIRINDILYLVFEYPQFPGDIFLGVIPDFFNDFDYWNNPDPCEYIDDDNFYNYYDPSIDDSPEEI